MSASLPQQLIESASALYQPADKFAYHFARGKLTADPAFVALLKLGLIPDSQRLLDLGCGQGLLAAWLVSAHKLFTQGRGWDDWPPPPRFGELIGIDLMPRDIARARQALAEQATFSVGDICQVALGQADVIVLLDVLHYLDYETQARLLHKIRAALPDGGVFITRVGDQAAGLPCLISQWVDAVASVARGHRRWPRFYCRPLAQWQELLTELGFSVQIFPMSEGTLFANYLIVAKRHAREAVTDIQKS